MPSLGVGAKTGRSWLRTMYATLACGGRLGGRHAQLGQEAAVVGLHSFLGQPVLGVVPEGTDHFPLEGLPSGLDWTDGASR